MILIAVNAAHADPQGAQRHLDRGVAAFRAGEFTRARTEFRAARDLAPDRPNPYRWLALSEVQLGDCAAALPNITEFTRRVPADDARLPEMTRWAELCRRTGVLRVDSVPRATLRLDGAVVGATPFRALSLSAGPHKLVADQPGFRTAARDIVLAPGGELAVTFELERARKPLVRRWWFWGAVGVVAVAAGTIAITAASGDDTTLLPPIQCDPAGCR
jgi:hypothetical protein